jgi:uncharacterized protein
VDKAKPGARIAVKVQPRAKRTELGGRSEDVYKVRLAAPPVDGKANEELVRYFAERFGVARSAIRIVRGQTSRSKVVEIEGVAAEQVERILSK